MDGVEGEDAVEGRRRRQSGDVTDLEAHIGQLVLGSLGSGLVYGIGRHVVADERGHGIGAGEDVGAVSCAATHIRDPDALRR